MISIASGSRNLACWIIGSQPIQNWTLIVPKVDNMEVMNLTLRQMSRILKAEIKLLSYMLYVTRGSMIMVTMSLVIKVRILMMLVHH